MKERVSVTYCEMCDAARRDRERRTLVSRLRYRGSDELFLEAAERIDELQRDVNDSFVWMFFLAVAFTMLGAALGVWVTA